MRVPTFITATNTPKGKVILWSFGNYEYEIELGKLKLPINLEYYSALATFDSFVSTCGWNMYQEDTTMTSLDKDLKVLNWISENHVNAEDILAHPNAWAIWCAEYDDIGLFEIPARDSVRRVPVTLTK